MCVAVFGQFVPNVEMGQLQQRTQVVFKLHTSEAPHGAATILSGIRLRGSEQVGSELFDDGFAFLGADFGLLGRRHLAFFDKVKHSRPPASCLGLIEIKG